MKSNLEPNVEGVDCRKKEKFPTSLLGKLTLTKAPIAYWKIFGKHLHTKR